VTRVFDASGGRIYFADPATGYVALDTAKPMPATIGEIAFNNVGLTFPKIPGEQTHGEVTSNGVRYWTTYAAYNSAASIVLGDFTGSVPPTIINGLVRIRRTTGGGNVIGLIEAPLAVNEWLQWPGGSLLLEVFGQAGPIHLWRHIDISVSGGKWRLNYRQGNAAKTTSKSYSIVSTSTSSVFSIDLKLSWGVFR
jgi:hypothetical protein